MRRECTSSPAAFAAGQVLRDAYLAVVQRDDLPWQDHRLSGPRLSSLIRVRVFNMPRRAMQGFAAGGSRTEGGIANPYCRVSDVRSDSNSCGELVVIIENFTAGHPVTAAELAVIETYLTDVLDEVFGPSRASASPPPGHIF